MKFRNTRNEFGLISKLLHWLIAMAMISMIAMGWYMIGLDEESVAYWRFFDLHVAIGTAMIIFFLLKIIWMAVSPSPGYVPGLKAWERFFAGGVHIFFIVAIGLIPVAGFLYVASEGEAINIYDAIEIPDIGTLSKSVRDMLYDVHMYIAYCCAALIVVHIMAALKHHFVDLDDTFRRMTTK